MALVLFWLIIFMKIYPEETSDKCRRYLLYITIYAFGFVAFIRMLQLLLSDLE